MSIPPVLRGELFVDSAPSGLQHRLIRTWIEAGFQPISVNTFSELSACPRHEECLLQAGVDVLPVPPSSGGYPVYLPNLREAILLAVERFPTEVIALTNADIHICLDADASESLRTLGNGNFLLAHRTDVKDETLFESTSEQRREMGLNSMFVPGIDFVAARAETLRESCAFLSPHLTIGLPWWDLLLPMALYAAGATRSFLDSRYFLHVQHQERWDPRWLNQVGTAATRYLYQQIENYKAPASAYVWSLAYANLVSPWQSLRVCKSRFLTRVENLKRGNLAPSYILEVLRMTEALVCHQGWELDRRWISTWYPNR